MKKRGFGVQKWNGVGGKPENNESLEQTAVREAKEEIKVNINPQDLEKVADFKFYFSKDKKDWNQEVHVYFYKKWQNEPQETEEMIPQWFDFDKIPYNEMWAGDKYWFPRVLKGEKLEGEFYFNEDTNKLDKIDIRSMPLDL